VRKPEGKKPLGPTLRRWEDNIKVDFRRRVVGVWAGSSWFRIGTYGRHL